MPGRGVVLEGHTRKQTTFGNTQRSASCQEPRVVGNRPHERTAYTPGHHDNRDPERRTGFLHHQVRWDLGGDVEWEEDGECDLIRQYVPEHTQSIKTKYIVIKT